MGIISVFTDESGDLGALGKFFDIATAQFQDRYYIISFVFHEQSKSINDSLIKLNHYYSMFEDSVDNKKYIHFGPLIRREDNFYKTFTIEDVRKIFFAFAGFIKNSDIRCYTIVLDKRNVNSENEFKNYFINEINNMFIRNYHFFNRNNTAIEYYDSGQKIVKKIIEESVIKQFGNNDMRMNINPRQYRLFQACDFLCTIKLIELKRKAGKYSGIEKLVFNDKKSFRRILDIIKDKSLD